MLVLTRKPNQVINIGDQITVRILRIQGNQVRIGIEAPPGVHILRGELERPQAQRDVPPVKVSAFCVTVRLICRLKVSTTWALSGTMLPAGANCTVGAAPVVKLKL